MPTQVHSRSNSADRQADLYGWAMEQASLLRAGRFEDMDLDGAVREIENVARSEQRELRRGLELVIVHSLKWTYQAQRRGPSWEHTIKEQRRQCRDVLAENPGLKPQLPEMVIKSYSYAVKQAAHEMNTHQYVFPEACPYGYETLVDDTFWPEAEPDPTA